MLAAAMATFSLAYKLGANQARRKYVNDILIEHQQRVLRGEVPYSIEPQLIR
jgi:hypothetical protein